MDPKQLKRRSVLEDSASEQVEVAATEVSDKTPFMAWVVTVSIMLVNAACNIMWTTCSSAPTPTSEWMQIDFSQLNWLSNACAIANTVLSLVCGWAYERFGVKPCIAFAGCINLLGCWIRYLSVVAPPEKRYAIVMLGQTIGGLGGPFAYKCFLVVAIIATACAIPILVMPKKPKVPPSVSAAVDRTSIWQGVKMLAKNGQYINLVIASAINCGMFYAISVIIIQAAAPYGYTDQQGGIAMAVLTISGYAVVYNAFGVLICSCFAIGFFSMGLFPIQLEYACEISYPVPEAVASNIIWSLNTVAMLIFTVISDALRAGDNADPPGNMHKALIVSAVLVGVGSLPCVWIKGDMRRLAVDRHKGLTV
ncbi:major facilitator superfamily domain-containing protein [Dichotomocladium elegans]|nr:major facilitator superfamily domain-containing protein [Dichotomocladium elegans]